MTVSSSPDVFSAMPSAPRSAASSNGSTPSALRLDLAYAAALAGAAERMGDAADLAELWPLVTAESMVLVHADGVAVVEYRRRAWQPLAARIGDGVLDAAAGLAVLRTVGVQELLDDPGRIDDLPAGTPPAAGWRSLLAIDLDRRPSGVSTRILWFAERPSAFGNSAEVAGLLARHAAAAARAVTTRETLGYAVAARHRIGQAQGIMMMRYQITADRAFAVLQRQSQDTNTKLRTIADHVIATGGLPAGPVPLPPA